MDPVLRVAAGTICNRALESSRQYCWGVCLVRASSTHQIYRLSSRLMALITSDCCHNQQEEDVLKQEKEVALPAAFGFSLLLFHRIVRLSHPFATACLSTALSSLPPLKRRRWRCPLPLCRDLSSFHCPGPWHATAFPHGLFTALSLPVSHHVSTALSPLTAHRLVTALQVPGSAEFTGLKQTPALNMFCL